MLFRSIIICIIVCACKRGKSAKREKSDSAQQSSPKTFEKEENAEPVAEVAPVKEERAKPVAPPVAPAKEDKPAPVKAAATPAEKPAEKTTDKKAAKPAEEDSGKVYHISKRRDENRWQIKAEGAARAIKLFNTQAEAIAYAKQLAQNQEARIMIHKEDGSFRKLTY